MRIKIKILLVIISLFFSSCKERIKKQERKSVIEITQKTKQIPNQNSKTIYSDMVALKENNDFTFLNYISKIPKATLPINSEDYKIFLIERKLDTKGVYKKYIVNEKSLKGYPIFFTSHFDFNSIKESKISEISIFNKSLSNYSIQKFKEDPMSDDFFHYIIPVFYFSVNDIYVVGYISTLDRGDSADVILIQVYDKNGESLDSKWDYVNLLYAYANLDIGNYSYRNSDISKNYIITENRQNNNLDVPNRIVKYKITKEGLEIIKK